MASGVNTGYTNSFVRTQGETPWLGKVETGGIGVARERDIELLMDAETEIAREMGWDPFSDGIFLSVLHVVRCEHVWW